MTPPSGKLLPEQIATVAHGNGAGPEIEEPARESYRFDAAFPHFSPRGARSA